MLKIENLTLKYGQSQILNGVSLNANAGEVTAVMGTNGVGKTSLLKAIAGRHPYAEGKIILDGTPIDHLNAFDAAKAGIAYVPQGREIFPMMTVVENLETIIKQIGNVIRILCEQGDMAIVLVEQFFDFAYDLGDEFTVLKRGEVVLNERASDLQRDRLFAQVTV